MEKPWTAEAIGARSTEHGNGGDGDPREEDTGVCHLRVFPSSVYLLLRAQLDLWALSQRYWY